MELYALNGFNNVSISDLQYALDIGRGTLYYYFSDQDELFIACMERYFLEPKHRALQSVPEDAGIDTMIGAMLEYLHSLDLHRKAQRLALKELELWRKAIYHDQRAGLVRRDIDRDQIALMFTHIKNTYDSGLGKTQMDFSLLEKTYSEFHKLLKIS